MGNAVGGVYHVGRSTSLGTDLLQSFLDFFSGGGDVKGVIVEGANLVNDGGAFAGGGPRLGDVFEILPATRVGTVGGRDKSQSPPHSVSLHLDHGVGQHRVPVPVAPIHRELRA